MEAHSEQREEEYGGRGSWKKRCAGYSGGEKWIFLKGQSRDSYWQIKCWKKDGATGMKGKLDHRSWRRVEGKKEGNFSENATLFLSSEKRNGCCVREQHHMVLICSLMAVRWDYRLTAQCLSLIEKKKVVSFNKRLPLWRWLSASLALSNEKPHNYCLF